MHVLPASALVTLGIPLLAWIVAATSSDSVGSSQSPACGGATLGYRSEGEGGTTRTCCRYVEPAALS